jgi:Domain of unknown function (DUF4145)
MPVRGLRLFITVLALLLALAHIIFPSITIDFVTIVLLLVAVLPWIAPIVKSVELPGGFKIQLQDVKEAARELLRADEIVQPASGEMRTEGYATKALLEAQGALKVEAEVMTRAEAAVASLKSVAGTDPNLALVGFRIEIEKRLRELARNRGLDSSLGVSAMLRELRRRELLPPRVGSSLNDLIALGNQAAHGVTVEFQTADWVFEVGPDVLAALDRILRTGEHG